MGVRRALEKVLGQAYKEPGPIFTYGPLIHNEQVMKLLESKGVRVAKDISTLKEGTLIIRAHGIPPQERKLLKNSGLKIIDATCPRVARVQALIRYHTHKGYLAVIVGEQDHPEVIGLKGHGNGRALVISTSEEVSLLPEGEKILVVAQTTQRLLSSTPSVMPPKAGSKRSALLPRMWTELWWLGASTAETRGALRRWLHPPGFPFSTLKPTSSSTVKSFPPWKSSG